MFHSLAESTLKLYLENCSRDEYKASGLIGLFTGCCVFRPVFSCCMHLKAGQNTFLQQLVNSILKIMVHLQMLYSWWEDAALRYPWLELWFWFWFWPGLVFRERAWEKLVDVKCAGGGGQRVTLLRLRSWHTHIDSITNIRMQEDFWYRSKAGFNTRTMGYRPTRLAHRDPQEGLLKLDKKFTFFAFFYLFISLLMFALRALLDIHSLFDHH